MVFVCDGGVSIIIICKRGGFLYDCGLLGWMISSGEVIIKVWNLINKFDLNVLFYDWF